MDVYLIAVALIVALVLYIADRRRRHRSREMQSIISSSDIYGQWKPHSIHPPVRRGLVARILEKL